MRYFYSENKNALNIISYFTDWGFRCIIDNKVSFLPYYIGVTEKYYNITNVLFVNHSDNPYFFNVMNPELAVRNLDELLEKEIEDSEYLKNYVTEISEEDALNPNNYELQSDDTYKYIKI